MRVYVVSSSGGQAAVHTRSAYKVVEEKDPSVTPNVL